MAQSENWSRNYKLLEEYHQEHGNIDVPRDYEINGIKLGQWLTNQRQAYKGNSKIPLTQDRVNLLNKLNIKWNVNEDNFEIRYKLLEEYYKEHGNIDLPMKYEVNGIKLGYWLDHKKSAYQGKGKNKITKEEIDKLNKLGITWSINKEKWNNNYQLLEKYYQEHGNIDVPFKYEIEGIKLGDWLSKQRNAYKSKKLSKEKIDKLNKLNIKWIIIEDNWNEKYQLLEEYYKENGNTDVPIDYEKDGIKLGKWVRNQRAAYQGNGSNKINQEQIDKLNKLGFKWNFYEDNWNRNYQLLEKYYEKNGHIDVQREEKIDDIRLGNWVHRLRTAYNNQEKSNLTKEQIAKLNKLGMTWYFYYTKWTKNYKLLVEYYKTFGNIDVPQKYISKDVYLGYWLDLQRKQYQKNNKKLTNSRIRKLNKLNIDWNIKETKQLNKKNTDIKVYNEVLNKRVSYVLRDLTLEGINQINSKDDQQAIEKELIKRIWR